MEITKKQKVESKQVEMLKSFITEFNKLIRAKGYPTRWLIRKHNDPITQTKTNNPSL